MLVEIKYDKMILFNGLGKRFAGVLLDTSNHVATIYNVEPEPGFTDIDGAQDASELYNKFMSYPPIVLREYNEDEFLANLRTLRRMDSVSFAQTVAKFCAAGRLPDASELKIACMTFPDCEGE